MKDYSQNGEQAHFLKALGEPEKHPGRVLEIGAWDPWEFSSSRALIELGWEALLFEPSPHSLKHLVEEYGNNSKIEVVGCPVTAHGGFVKLRLSDDAVSCHADDAAHYQQWRERGGFYGIVTMLSISVAELFNHWGGAFEFVSIDTEGTSVALFNEMIRCGPRPRCVMVEHDGQHVELARIAEAANYRTVHLGTTNTILEWTGK